MTGGNVTDVTEDPAKTAASRRGRASRRKGVTFAGVARKAYEAAVGPVIVPMQEADGDDCVDVVNGISIEFKCQKAMALASWVDQAAAQGIKRGLVPIVVHKRAGTTDPGRWYVTIELRFFAELVHQLKRGRA